MSDEIKQEDNNQEKEKPKSKVTRRDFLATLTMASGLVASYGTLGWIAGRFLYPSRPTLKQWTFVTEVKKIKVGNTYFYQTPIGQKVAITRKKDQGVVEDFIALSTECPHLGCQVHWEPQNNRFFCPCHNGVFDTSGKGIKGPPGDAGQSLPTYPLKIEKGLLFIEIEVESLAQNSRSPNCSSPGKKRKNGGQFI